MSILFLTYHPFYSPRLLASREPEFNLCQNLEGEVHVDKGETRLCRILSHAGQIFVCPLSQIQLEGSIVKKPTKLRPGDTLESGFTRLVLARTSATSELLARACPLPGIPRASRWNIELLSARGSAALPVFKGLSITIGSSAYDSIYLDEPGTEPFQIRLRECTEALDLASARGFTLKGVKTHIAKIYEDATVELPGATTRLLLIKR